MHESMNPVSPKKRRSILHVPVFRPTEEQFSNPLRFIQKVKECGEAFGIVKIVTPEHWRPTTLPTTEEMFSSYRQAIHELNHGHIFKTGGNYSVARYKDYADNMEQKWREAHSSRFSQSFFDRSDTKSDEEWTTAVQDCYWSMVEGRTKEEANVDYASNLPIESEFENGSWNFKSLINLKENIVNRTGVDIPGVTSPWLYFGCLFATFCWHVEDQFLYSMNYLHTGAKKIWYGIPSSSALAFEDYASSSCVTRSMKASLLQDMTRMISPFELPENISVYTAVQQPGDMIITFPEAFHAGYSEGWNVAEAVNFALMDWIPFGMKADRRYRRMKAPVFSMDKLVWNLAKQAFEDAEEGVVHFTSELKTAFLEACKTELENRDFVMKRLYRVKGVVPRRRWDGDPPQCSSCKCLSYFAYVFCTCMIADEEVLCCKDCFEIESFACGCRPFLCMEVSDNDIKAMIKKVESDGSVLTTYEKSFSSIE